MIKAVIIDLDDTLFQTEPIAFEMENEALRRMGRPAMSRAIHLKTWGEPLFEAIATRSPNVDVDEFKRRFVRVIDKFSREGKIDVMTDKNLRVLDVLINEGKQLFILTSRVQVEASHLLHPQHVLAGRITNFYHWENTAFHKPDPRVFEELLRDYDFRPNECVYIGDSVGDAKAAREAGLYFIANLESGLRAKYDFVEHGVDFFIDAFHKCGDVMHQLEGMIND